MKPKILVLLSGGLDSATVLALLAHSYELHALSFDYGQKHKVELRYAKRLCSKLGVPHTTIELPKFPANALTSKDIPVDVTKYEDIGKRPPNTFVPGRNIVMLALAGSFACRLGISTIAVGVNALDYSGYPDCRPEFIASMQSTLSLGLGRPITLLAPLQNKTKLDIVRMAHAYGLDIDRDTWSCYSPAEDSTPCGVCDSCQLRNKALTDYRKSS